MTEHEFNNHAHTYCKHWHNPVPFILVYSAQNIKAKKTQLRKLAFLILKVTLQLRFSLKKPLMLNFKPVFSFSSELLYNPAQFLSVWEWLQEMQVKSFEGMRGMRGRMWHWDTLARLLFTLMEDQPKDWTVMDLGSPGVSRATAAPLLLFVLCNTSHFVFNTVKSL